MIDKLTYEQVSEMIHNLREQKEIVRKLARGRSVPEVIDFVDAVETYCKFLEGIIELNQAADEAIKGLV